MQEKKLNFELVPDGCWYSNLRSILKPKEWEIIKQDAKNRAGGKCMICGKITDKLDAHEKWSYDEKTATQKLVDVIAVCKDCHNTIHIGRTSLMGNLERAEDHYIKVNNCSYCEMKKDLSDANIVHQRRNKISEWKLDISWLKRFTKEM